MFEENMCGKIYNLTEGQIKAMDAVDESGATAHTAFQTASKMVKETKEELWKTLRQMYPELEKYHLSYDHKDHTLTILREKNADELQF